MACYEGCLSHDVRVCVPLDSACFTHRPLQPWLYLGVVSSYQLAGLQPLPAPAAAPLAPFNPHLPLHIDVDTLLTAWHTPGGPASSSSSSSAEQQGEAEALRQRLQQQLVCRGQQLPPAAAAVVIQGGIAKSLLLLQRTPQMACQCLLGERLMYAVPLMLFEGEPVRLMLLLELFSTPAGPSTGEKQQQQQQEPSGVMYCSQHVLPFAEVYPAIRALGPCDWVSWVKEAVAALEG